MLLFTTPPESTTHTDSSHAPQVEAKRRWAIDPDGHREGQGSHKRRRAPHRVRVHPCRSTSHHHHHHFCGRSSCSAHAWAHIYACTLRCECCNRTSCASCCLPPPHIHTVRVSARHHFTRSYGEPVVVITPDNYREEAASMDFISRFRNLDHEIDKEHLRTRFASSSSLLFVFSRVFLHSRTHMPSSCTVDAELLRLQ